MTESAAIASIKTILNSQLGVNTHEVKVVSSEVVENSLITYMAKIACLVKDGVINENVRKKLMELNIDNGDEIRFIGDKIDFERRDEMAFGVILFNVKITITGD